MYSLKMKRVVTGEVVAAICGADRFVSGVSSQLKDLRIQVHVHSERKGEIPDRPPDSLGEFVSRGDDFIPNRLNIDRRSQIEMGASVETGRRRRCSAMLQSTCRESDS